MGEPLPHFWTHPVSWFSGLGSPPIMPPPRSRLSRLELAEAPHPSAYGLNACCSYCKVLHHLDETLLDFLGPLYELVWFSGGPLHSNHWPPNIGWLLGFPRTTQIKKGLRFFGHPPFIQTIEWRSHLMPPDCHVPFRIPRSKCPNPSASCSEGTAHPIISCKIGSDSEIWTLGCDSPKQGQASQVLRPGFPPVHFTVGPRCPELEDDPKEPTPLCPKVAIGRGMIFPKRRPHSCQLVAFLRSKSASARFHRKAFQGWKA